MIFTGLQDNCNCKDINNTVHGTVLPSHSTGSIRCSIPKAGAGCMKSIGTPLGHSTGHNVLISFAHFNQMCQGLLHYASSPLVDVVMIVVLASQDCINTLFDDIMCFLSIEATLVAGSV